MMDPAIFRYSDVDGDRMAIFPAMIPGQGTGVNIRTDRHGSSIPDAKVPDLIAALQRHLERINGS